MDFEWDEHKRRVNLEKHGLDFIRAAEMFDGQLIITVPSVRPAEERFLSVGRLEGRFIAVIWTWREDAIRLISARRARSEEADWFVLLSRSAA